MGANRRTDESALGRVVRDLCESTRDRQKLLKFFDCGYVPEECAHSVWHRSDYILSVYYDELESTGNPHPLKDCYFNGSAIFASASYLYTQPHDFLKEACIVSKDPEHTPLTSEGYATILRQHNHKKNLIILKRLLKSKVFRNATACNEKELKKFARDPSLDLTNLRRDLSEAWWICGRTFERSCTEKCEP